MTFGCSARRPATGWPESGEEAGAYRLVVERG